MDERYIPDPVIKPEHKKRQHRGQKGLVCEFVLKRLKEGRLSDQQIAEECSILYDGTLNIDCTAIGLFAPILTFPIFISSSLELILFIHPILLGTL